MVTRKEVYANNRNVVSGGKVWRWRSAAFIGPPSPNFEMLQLLHKSTEICLVLSNEQSKLHLYQLVTYDSRAPSVLKGKD